MTIGSFVFKAFRTAIRHTTNIWSHGLTMLFMYGNNVRHQSFHTNGVPFISVARRGYCSIGEGLKMNNRISGNPIGPNRKCIIFVDNDAELIIGNHVGLSQCALVSTCHLLIEDHVKIGGGTSVFTSDFHALNPQERAGTSDHAKRKNAPVHIKRNAFIGANCLVLKGVTIGENSIIGAGSVVTKSVPDNELWAGNPAKFIRSLEH